MFILSTFQKVCNVYAPSTASLQFFPGLPTSSAQDDALNHNHSWMPSVSWLGVEPGFRRALSVDMDKSPSNSHPLTQFYLYCFLILCSMFCTCVCMWVSVYMHVPVCACICVYLCVWMCTYVYLCVHMYTCVPVCAHVYVCTWKSDVSLGCHSSGSHRLILDRISLAWNPWLAVKYQGLPVSASLGLGL